MFGSTWSPASEEVVTGWIPGVGFGTVTNSKPAQYNADILEEGSGNLNRIWREIEEESDQYFVNGKLPFEQWSGEKGYVKLGLFDDKVKRSFDQRNYSNRPDTVPGSPPTWIGGDWSEYWSDNYDPSLNPGSNPDWYNIWNSPYGASYEAEQQISAWYWMVDVPLCSFFKVTGGTRYEKTRLDIEFKADPETKWYDRDANEVKYLAFAPPDNTGIDQKDIIVRRLLARPLRRYPRSHSMSMPGAMFLSGIPG
jgi:hypothetical protein